MKEHGFMTGIYVLLLGPLARRILDGPREIGLSPKIEDLFLVAAASVAAAFVASFVFNKLLSTLGLGVGKRLTVEQTGKVTTKATPYVLLAVAGLFMPALLQMLEAVSYERKAPYVVALLVV
ncbi:hypothetical protein O4J55_26550, partial [Paracoccus sp. PXZ]